MRARSSTGRSTVHIPHDTSMNYHNISQENSFIQGRKSSYDTFKHELRDDESGQFNYRKSTYLDNILLPRQTEAHRTQRTSEALLNENSELKNQRDQYLSQLKKNEEMLWKAKEVISHLKSDIHLENLSKDLQNQLNNYGTKTTENTEMTSRKNEQKIKELMKKLQIKESQIQELNQVISKLNVDNHGLQSKLVKAVSKIKELRARNENNTTKMDTSYADQSQRLSSKGDLQKKLDTTIQYNYDLFSNYTNIMKENSEMQGRIFALEQEIGKLKGDVLDKHTSISIIRETEHKVDNIEHNISKIEETSFILPQIEQKLDNLQRLNKDKMKVIKSAVQLMHEEVNKTLQLLSQNDRQILSDLSVSQSSIILSNVNTLRGDIKSTITFPELINTIHNDDVREIVEMMQPEKFLKPVLQKMMRCVYVLFMEKFYSKTTRNLATLEQKIKRLERIKPVQPVQKTDIYAINPFQSQTRSKSVLAPRRQTSMSNYGSAHDYNKENSFINVLNSSNSRF